MRCPETLTFAACLLAVTVAAAADQAQAPAPASAPAAQRPGRDWDDPVLNFLRTPALLLITPQEALEYDALTSIPERRVFIDRFWRRVGKDCPAEVNPFRDELFSRAETAMKQFADEGIPGWLTDRGRFFVLLGPPATTATEGEGAAQRLVWTYEAPAPGAPRTVAFVRDRLRWTFAGADADAGAAPRPVAAIVSTLAAGYRARQCELTPEQREAATLLAWRKDLYDAANSVLAGQAVTVQRPVEPAWYFFPAGDDATLVILTVPLERPLGEGQRLAATLLREGAEDGQNTFGIGGEDFPFEIREAGADGQVAQAVRSLPAGRYAVALGVVDGAGQVERRYVGEQMVVRFNKGALRLTSIIFANQLKPLDAGAPQDVRPFRIAGYEIVPRPSRVARSGETVTFFGVVTGAGEAGDVDLTVRYQLQLNQPGKGWINVGPPAESPNVKQDVLARDITIHPKLPQADYKLVIVVRDNRSGSEAKQEVPFRITPNA